MPTRSQPVRRSRLTASRPPPRRRRPQNAEILTLTYGSVVRQLVADCEDGEEVNRQLDKM